MLKRAVQRWPPAPAVALLLVGFLAGFIGYTTAPTDETAGVNFDADDRASMNIRGSVQSLTAYSVTLASEQQTRTFRFAQTVVIETLRPAAITSVRPGDWVNAGAVQHAQTLFVLTGLVVIPDGSLKAPNP